MNNFNIHIDTNAFLDSLGYMGIGMAGIFAVTIVIVLAMMALNKISSKKSDK